MSTSHPTLNDICDAFARMAERVSVSPTAKMDPFVSISVRRAAEELRRFIPGLDPAPDQGAADFLARAAYAALEDDNHREALARALRGLSFAPHHPGLWFAVASACFECGAVEDAVRSLRHTLWIHPGHTSARRDLEALNTQTAERWAVPDSTPPEAPSQGLDLPRHTATDAEDDGCHPDSDRYADEYFSDDEPDTPDD